MSVLREVIYRENNFNAMLIEWERGDGRYIDEVIQDGFSKLGAVSLEEWNKFAREWNEILRDSIPIFIQDPESPTGYTKIEKSDDEIRKEQLYLEAMKRYCGEVQWHEVLNMLRDDDYFFIKNQYEKDGTPNEYMDREGYDDWCELNDTGDDQ